ncbi:MAG: molybdopterin-dependent oxidoreductase [Pirellulales bacterium]|nr:molybdopterin-dependent oxidoreductase [Pirellulales bacterium]
MYQLRIFGTVEKALELTAADLAALPASALVPDVSQLDPKRAGRAVRLAALLDQSQPSTDARYLTLHSGRDDFHASIPLAAVRDQAVIIFERDGQPLPESAGGPFRFLIPDLHVCHTLQADGNPSEIDECANVKYLASLELSAERGHDNRPVEERAHAELHRRQG